MTHSSQAISECSAQPPTPLRDYATLFLIVATSAIAISLLQRWDILFSHILVQDDQTYLVDFLLFDSDPSGISLSYLKWYSQTFGLIGSRVYLILNAAISIGILSCIILWATKSKVISLSPLLAALAVSSETQFIFINGSHTTSALPAIAAFCGAIIILWQANYRLTIACAALASILAFIVATNLTTVAPGLTISALTILTSPASQGGKNYIKMATTIFVALFGPAYFYIFSFINKAGRNHYLDNDGWVDFNIERSFSRIAEAVDYLSFEMPFLLILFIIAASISTVAFTMSLRTKGRNPTLDIFGPQRSHIFTVSLLFIAVAALCYAPAVTVPQSAARYFEIPTLFVGTALITLILSMLQRNVRKPGLAAAFIVALPVSIFSTRAMLEDTYGSLAASTHAIERGLQQHIEHIPLNAQIIIVGRQLPFSGFNHWSTGTLRFLTGRVDVIGLIGNESSIGSYDPFVQSWRRHGPEYWRLDNDGVRRRIQMIGLEQGRPTFGFRFDHETGELRPAEIVSFDNNGQLVASFGQAFQSDAIIQPSSLKSLLPSCHSRNAAAPIVFGAPSTELNPQPSRPIDTNFMFVADGASSESLSLGAQAFVAEFWIAPTEQEFTNEGLNATYPPTPILARGWFQLWQTAQSEWVLQAETAQIRVEYPVLYFRVAYTPGCGATIRIGQQETLLPAPEGDSFTLQLGRGFLDRYWNGEIVGNVTLIAEDEAVSSSAGEW